MPKESIQEEFSKWCETQGASSVGQVHRKAILDMANAEELAGKRFSEFSSEEIVWQVERYCHDYATFTNRKYFLSMYLKWLATQSIDVSNATAELQKIKYSEMDMSNLLIKSYWPNFNSLNDTFHHYVGSDLENYNLQRAIVYLAWCGLRMEEAVKIRKTDIDLGQACIRSKELDVCLFPETEILSFLSTYAEQQIMEKTVWKGSVIDLPLPESPYLLRTCSSASLDNKKIGQALNRLNSRVGKMPKEFKYDRIYWSGIFCRTNQEGQTPGLIEKKTVRTSDLQAREDEYQFYAKMFRLEGAKRIEITKRYKQYTKFKRCFNL